MKIGGMYSITFEFDNSSFNYIRIGLSSPGIYAKSDVHDFYAEEQKSYAFVAPTKIGLDTSPHHWSFTAMILGFGVKVIRQWSY